MCAILRQKGKHFKALINVFWRIKASNTLSEKTGIAATSFTEQCAESSGLINSANPVPAATLKTSESARKK